MQIRPKFYERGTEIDFSDLGEIDGVDLWNALSEDLTSERTDVLHNIDDIYGNAALTVGEWKIVKGKILCMFSIS